MDFDGQGRGGTLRAQAGRIDARFLVAGRCALYLLMGAVMASARVMKSKRLLPAASTTSCRSSECSVR